MLSIVLAVLTAASPSPSPTPFLKTIITVKSSPLCGALAAHANAAIGSAVANDQTLGTAILALRSNDLANSTIDRYHEIHRLSSLADNIYRQYRSGENEIAQLRDLEKQTNDIGEKAELKAAADALGGALYRQHLIQRDLDGFVAFLEASDMMTDDGADGPRHPMTQDMPGAYPVETEAYWLPSMQNALIHPPLLAGSESLEDDARMAKSASQDFQNRIPAVQADELTASSHIGQAADGC